MSPRVVLRFPPSRKQATTTKIVTSSFANKYHLESHRKSHPYRSLAIIERHEIEDDLYSKCQNANNKANLEIEDYIEGLIINIIPDQCPECNFGTKAPFQLFHEAINLISEIPWT